MDIVASIVAYLTCVAGIIGAFALSLFVLFAAPDRPALPQDAAPVVLAAKHAPPPPNVATRNAPPAGVEKDRAVSAGKSLDVATKAAPSPQTAATQPPPVDLRPKLPSAQARRLAARQERDRHLAYPQNPLARRDPDFAARFLGYAE